MNKKLPLRPNLEQLKKQAKTLQKGHQSASATVLTEILQHHPQWHGKSESELKIARFPLSDAQWVIARQYGFKSWAELKAHMASRTTGETNEASVKALRDAAGTGDIERVKELLAADPGLIDEVSSPGMRTALHDAAAQGRDAVVEYLLDNGADPNIRCEGDSAMPLHFAAENQHLSTIKLLIEHGADPIGEGDYHELDVIGWATSFDYLKVNPEVAAYLLSHGARHNIFSAVSMGAVESIREIVSQSRANLERRMDLTNKRRRPLHLAVVKKQKQSLATLLELGASTESLDEAGFTALDQAALIGEREMSQMLIDAGAKLRLPAAIALERIADAQRLLRRDPDCLKPGKRWGHLIVRASEVSTGSVVEKLIQAGASVDVRDDPKTAIDSTSGFTPLHGAAWFGNASTVEVLLQHGANVRVREERWRATPASWANYAGHKEVRDLILRGDIEIMEAVDFGLASRIAAILQQEPDVLNKPFRDYPIFPMYVEGWYTPLVLAVIRADVETARVLLQHGADASVRSPDGQTLVELAGSQEMIDLLKA